MLNKNSFVLNHSCNSLQKNYGWRWLSHWIVTDVLSLFSITPFPIFSKDRCASWKKIQVSRCAEFWEWSTRASLPEFRAACYEFFLCFSFLCVFFFNSRDWLRRKGMTPRCLFQMLSYVFIIDSPFEIFIEINPYQMF